MLKKKKEKNGSIRDPVTPNITNIAYYYDLRRSAEFKSGTSKVLQKNK